MAFKTLSSLTNAQVGANGQKSFAGVLTADDLNHAFNDDQAAPMEGLLAGVLFGGACTASALNVTIPANTIYFARTVWINDADLVVGVSDGTTTYLWGCSDGQIRSTSSTTPPSSFDTRSACILAVAIAVAGVVTLDRTGQQMGRYADGAAHLVSENAPVVAPVADTIPAGASASVPAGSQLQVMETLTIAGVLTIGGKVRVTS